MARINLRLHFQTVPIMSSPILTSFLVLLAIISVFSVLAFLCGSHKSASRNKGKTEQLGEKRPVTKLHSSISSRARNLMVAKMISWNKMEDEGENGHHFDDYSDDDETAIWKKGIIKGEKCCPLEFSGKILYDGDGNQIPDSPQPAQAG